MILSFPVTPPPGHLTGGDGRLGPGLLGEEWRQRLIRGVGAASEPPEFSL